MAERNSVSHGTAAGISLGTSLAVCISWSINKSIGWAILHGFCSWFYVLYYWLNN